nr:MAG TPA: tail length tape measure protein [Caudoviricetes sp.]
MIVRELVTRLGFKTDLSGLQKYEQSMDSMTKRVQGALTGIRAAMQAIGTGAAVLAVKRLAEATDKVTDLQSRLASLTQKSSFDELAKKAMDSGVAVEGYVDGFIRLAGATDGVLESQGDVVEILDTLNAGLKASGADAGTAAGVMRQFGQALGSGVLRGDELNSLNEGAGVLMRELARAIIGPTGTVGALRKLAEQGGLTTQVVLAGMKKIGHALRAQSNASTRTFGQALQQLGDTVWLTWARFDQAIGFTRGLTNALDWLSGVITSTIGFFGGMNRAVEVLSWTIGALAVARLPALVAAIASVGKHLWAMLAPIAPVITGIVGIGLVVDDLYSWIKGEDSLAGELFGDFDEFATAAGQWIDRVKAWLQPLYDAAMKVGDAVKAIFKADVSGAVNAVKGAAGDAGGWVADQASWAWNGLKNLTGFGNSSTTVTQNVVINGNATPQAVQQIRDNTEQVMKRGDAARAGR